MNHPRLLLAAVGVVALGAPAALTTHAALASTPGTVVVNWQIPAGATGHGPDSYPQTYIPGALPCGVQIQADTYTTEDAAMFTADGRLDYREDSGHAIRAHRFWTAACTTDTPTPTETPWPTGTPTPTSSPSEPSSPAPTGSPTASPSSTPPQPTPPVTVPPTTTPTPSPTSTPTPTSIPSPGTKPLPAPHPGKPAVSAPSPAPSAFGSVGSVRRDLPKVSG